MNDSILDDPALEPMVFWYAIDVFNQIEKHGRDTIQKAAEAAMEFSLGHPLFQRQEDGEFPTFVMNYLGERSGPYLAVLMAAFLVYTQRQDFGEKVVIPNSRLLQFADTAYIAWNELGFRADIPGGK